MLIRKFVQALVVVSCVGVAWASTEGQIGTPKELEPDIVGAGGEFTNRYAIDIPEFRGLPLPVSLSYNSSNTARGGMENTVGFGWKLNAFSKIERKSLGGGVPTFDDGQDLYVLDGQELMACDKMDGGAAALNPLGGYYPLRYLTDRDSASCLAGGNMTTRVESFRKIVFDEFANEFTVTRKDGTKYIYKSLGALNGKSVVGTEEQVCVSWSSGSHCTAWETRPATDYPLGPQCVLRYLGQCMSWVQPHHAVSQEQKVDFRTIWLLDRIEDAQLTPNVVQYTYNFSGKGHANAPRLAKIEYGNGYLVQFQYRNYQNRGVMVPKYATGTTVIGSQHFQLRSIRIYDGADKIRAYQIFHKDSVLSKAQLVTKIAAYGNDFQITGHDVTGGSVLDQEKYRYSADTVAFSEANESNTPGLAGTEFHRAVNVLDSDRDGADELLFRTARQTHRGQHSYKPSDDSDSVTYYTNDTVQTFPAGHFKFSVNRDFETTNYLQNICGNYPIQYTSDFRSPPPETTPQTQEERRKANATRAFSPINILGSNRKDSQIFCFRVRTHSQ